MINDIIFPSKDIYEAFEQEDQNIFSNGQVDVYFEKNFEFRRNIIVMDSQGKIN